MKLVCSYCGADLGEKPPMSSTDISHGMCDACLATFEAEWADDILDEFFEGLDQPVMFMTPEGRYIAGNQQIEDALGRADGAARGLLAGDLLSCSHAVEPGGCGHTTHCGECTVRGALTRAWTTGQDQVRVPAWVERDDGVADILISARRRDGVVQVTVEDRVAA